jgi:hypothetical protein
MDVKVDSVMIAHAPIVSVMAVTTVILSVTTAKMDAAMTATAAVIAPVEPVTTATVIVIAVAVMTDPVNPKNKLNG